MLANYNIKNSRAIAYDQLEYSIYWIDGKANIKRMQINGTTIEVVVVGGKDTQPLDLVIDPYSRLLFWSCNKTRAINVTRIGPGESMILGSVHQSIYDQPHLLAYHFKQR